MATNVTNTDADLGGKTLLTAENDEAITGLKTFNRVPDAPFAVAAGSPVVPGLNADMLDGYHVTDILGQQVRTSIVFIDNDAFKALPTTPVLIAPAPAAGQMLFPLWSLLMIGAGAVPYTNIDPDAFLDIIWTSVEAASSFMVNDSGLGITQVTDMLGAAGDTVHRFSYPFQDDRGAPNNWGLLLGNTAGALDAHAAQGLQLAMSNGGLGDLTGGDSGNQIKIITFFLGVQLP